MCVYIIIMDGGQIFNGDEKKYTFNILNYLDIKRDICNHSELYKDLHSYNDEQIKKKNIKNKK